MKVCLTKINKIHKTNISMTVKQISDYSQWFECHTSFAAGNI